ncbi:hypothetical protein GE061_003482 [Apolygus lucorum]|uniref:Aminopeptidase n=1 Tax=Apolygus lucorum TaxID=248454 RepID=A0A8S9X3P5_APOLU|nr:hypothetical protein GE061_003482 [Apolygus lucorum]
MSSSKNFQRLPGNIVPSLYKIFIKPDLIASTFEGNETITISINTPSKVIVLNTLDLDIKSSNLKLGDGKVLKPSDTIINKAEETITLDFGSDLATGEAFLSFEFSGVLNDSLKGLYRSRTSTSGPTKYAAVTQFAPTDARKCFPCWDEPAIKAVFEMTLSAPKDAVALSNMPCISEECDGDRKICKFAPSPVMSTYLVAIVVGDYDYVEGRSDDGVLVRVYTPPGVKEQGEFALYVSTKILPYYKDYFRIAYPLPKIDVIAVADLAYGAMENWGLVTFKQSCILVDPANTSASSKQRVASIIGHEFAHQWFGNIVTMEWWTDLWLNEGFASFIQELCVDHLFPQFDVWTQFVSDTLIRAMELDCLNNSHPIEVPVNHPSEINEIFDTISYCKGASILRMLHNYIGDDDYRKGLNVYLTRHQYKNTCTEDLWTALEEASNKPVGPVMSTWTKQKGFPLIKVSSSKQDGSSRIFTISQEKFVVDPASKSDNSEWLIPLSFSTQGRENKVVHKEVLGKKSAQITVPNVPPGAWVKLNAGTTGVYRVMYPQDLLDQFVPSMVNKSLPPLDRLGLLDDLLALVQAGKASSVQLLQIIFQLRDEENMTVWRVIANCLDRLEVVVANTDFANELKKFECFIFKPIMKKIGWDAKSSESHMDTLLRSVVSSGNVDTFNTMIQLFRETTLQEERDRITCELGFFPNEDILNKVMAFAMSDEVRAQDKLFVMLSVARTRIGRELVWDFFKSNWKRILEIYEGGFLLPRLVKSSLENFASESKAAEIENFFKSVDYSAATRSILQATESIRLNAAWLNRDGDQIKKFLVNFKY